MMQNFSSSSLLSMARRMMPKKDDGELNVPMLGLTIAAAVCAFAPMDLSQLIFALVGAFAYWLLQMLPPVAKRTSNPKKAACKIDKRPTSPNSLPGTSKRQLSTAQRTPTQRVLSPHQQQLHVQPEIRKPSSMPIGAPSFQGVGWEAEVHELLNHIMPTPESDLIVQRLARAVKSMIQDAMPEAEVTGFATGDLSRGKAFGVAVPDVDIVVNANPNVLIARLQKDWNGGRRNTASLDMRKLQKSAIRVCTDKLVASGGFKFRRSAFKGDEPKVTLLAASQVGVSDGALPLDLSVNSLTPMYYAGLLTECGQVDPRAKELMLLIKRWAKDRGICHAAKGHLYPYLWSLLTVYFLQVGVGNGEEAILPPLSEFELSARLGAHKERTSPRDASTRKSKNTSDTPTSQLFKDFMHFYNREFDWRNEAVCARLGQRGKAGLKLPLHIMLHQDGKTSEVGLTIEDPFNSSNNLGTCMVPTSIARLREELSRADDLCKAGSSMSKLLEPWVPPEQECDAADATTKHRDEE